MPLYPQPDPNKISHFLAYHGRNDRTVPLNGGESYDHYIYMGQKETMAKWADNYGDYHSTTQICSRKNPDSDHNNPFYSETIVTTPYSGGSKNIECKQLYDCTGVMATMWFYDAEKRYPHFSKIRKFGIEPDFGPKYQETDTFIGNNHWSVIINSETLRKVTEFWSKRGHAKLTTDCLRSIDLDSSWKHSPRKLSKGTLRLVHAIV